MVVVVVLVVVVQIVELRAVMVKGKVMLASLSGTSERQLKLRKKKASRIVNSNNFLFICIIVKASNLFYDVSYDHPFNVFSQKYTSKEAVPSLVDKEGEKWWNC